MANKKAGKTTKNVDVAIVGAGVAGLYCGFRLDQLAGRGKRADYLIAEASNHVGGRIWSQRIGTDGKALPDGGEVEIKNGRIFYKLPSNGKKAVRYPVEFVAEYGPMRIELDLQHCLEALIKDLGLEGDLEAFPAYQSPTSAHDPQYELAPEEQAQKTPLELLELAMVRVLGQLECVPAAQEDAAELDKRILSLSTQLSRATATRQGRWQDAFEAWAQDLDEADYDIIRRCGGLKLGHGVVALWQLGFWNMLSHVLSYHALLKLRDLGTFYHLIPENPNAAEWLVFWLRAVRTSTELKGIRGGMQRITENLHKKIDDRIMLCHRLVGIAPEGAKARLTFEVTRGGEVETETWLANKVVLALPTEPLLEIARLNRSHLYAGFQRDLSAVFGFPLLKAFFVAKEKWWSRNTIMTNRFATRIPTRELHHWNSKIPGSNKGMVMVYTDRPASAFWSNLVPPGPGSEPDSEIRMGTWDKIDRWSGVQETPSGGEPPTNPRLTQQAIRFLGDNGVQRKADDFDYVGVRDWGRAPYRGAAHSWYPERQIARYLGRLSKFTLGADPDAKGSATVHICGEAYSDYQAFIEGSLRSVEHVLHRMGKRKDKDTPTDWACDDACRKDHAPNPDVPWRKAKRRVPPLR